MILTQRRLVLGKAYGQFVVPGCIPDAKIPPEIRLMQIAAFRPDRRRTTKVRAPAKQIAAATSELGSENASEEMR